jgi:hypothetical protein
MSKKQLALAVVLGAAALLVAGILHPYLFGWSGRIGEAAFQKQLHYGMSRKDILILTHKYGGRGVSYMDLSSLKDPPYYTKHSRILDVQFTDFATFCIGGGKQFTFDFRPDWTLSEWRVNDWQSAC